MKFHHDSYYCIGSEHVRRGTPCQDYAFTGVANDETGYAIVSDGCSGSKNSDHGARLITHWFRNVLNNCPEYFPDYFDDFKLLEGDGLSLIEDFKSCFGDADLPTSDCLDATLVGVIARPIKDKSGYIVMIGDGGCCIKYRNGTVQAYMVHLTRQAPPYLSYHLQEDRKKNYKKGMKEERISLCSINVDTYGVTTYATGYIAEVVEAPGLYIPFYPEEVESVSVFTDGMFSFRSAQLSFVNALKQFIDVKTFAGEFVTRTCLGVLRNMQKENISHYDDFSMATLKIEHDNSAEVATEDRGDDTSSSAA